MIPAAVTSPEGYSGFRQGASWIDRPRSVLRIAGADAFDFLHRMTTGDLRDMPEGDVRRSVAVNEKGRVIDLLTVARHAGGATIIGTAGMAGELAAWFTRFVIADDVSVTVLGEDTPLRCVYGPQAARIARQAVSSGSAFAGLPPFVVTEDLGTIPGVLLLALSGSGQSGAPQVSGATEASPAAFEAVRIEESVPMERELGPDVNALEAGLRAHISFTKGCYIGQEVIARLDTYRKLRRILTLFEFPGHDGRDLAGGTLFLGDAEAGRITSTTASPGHGGWIGLGFRHLRLEGEGLELRPEGSNARIGCRPVPGTGGEYDIA